MNCYVCAQPLDDQAQAISALGSDDQPPLYVVHRGDCLVATHAMWLGVFVTKPWRGGKAVG
jgi:hypothetical protein